MENKMHIPFSPPDISEAEVQAVAQALRSGWITTGPRVKELEIRLADYVRADRVCCFNSQTASSEMALRLLGIGPGDEVITCAYTYTATASVVCHVGAKLVLVDCQKQSLQMDYDALESAITEKTKAIIPVDLGGVPCDYDRIFAIAEAKKHLFRPANPLQEAMGRMVILADGAHALGASRKGAMVGSIADFTAFSFHAVKNLTTAEGGALAWKKIGGVDSDILYRQLQMLSLHGQSKDAFAKSQANAWEYDVLGPWYKCNMTDVAGTMGLAQLDRYDAMLAHRRKIIALYDEALKPLGVGVLPHETAEHVSSAHLYLTWIPGITQDHRNEIIARMGQAGIACNVHYKPLPMLTAYKNLGFTIADYPNAYGMFTNEITLPLYSKLTVEQAAYVIDHFVRIVKDYLP